MFEASSVTRLETKIREWTDGFNIETDFEVQYQPVFTGSTVRYTAFVKVRWNTNVRIVG